MDQEQILLYKAFFDNELVKARQILEKFHSGIIDALASDLDRIEIILTAAWKFGYIEKPEKLFGILAACRKLRSSIMDHLEINQETAITGKELGMLKEGLRDQEKKAVIFNNFFRDLGKDKSKIQDLFKDEEKDKYLFN